MKKLIVLLLVLAFWSGINLHQAKAFDLSSRPPLEKKVFIHYRKNFVKPENPGKEKAPSCYGFLARGAKWKNLPIDYVVQDISMRKAVSAAANEWDSHTGVSLFGDSTVDNSATWSESYNGKNELVFDNYPQAGVIAITYVWGYFSVPPAFREIVEFDILFDTDFTWEDAVVNPTVMDVQNIATHEIGHGLGLGDVYQFGCNQVTMYGYSDYGEIQKRTLAGPDIKGLQTLYP